MKELGVLLLIVGGIGLIFAFNMSTTVTTVSQSIGGLHIPSQTVHNIGLMDERRNYLMITGLMVIVGVILFAFGNNSSANVHAEQTQISPTTSSDGTRKCPYCAETIKQEAITCRFCKKDLPPIDLEKEKKTEEATSFIAGLSDGEKARLEKYMNMTPDERREDCFACRGESAQCCMCDATEEKLKAYIEAKNIPVA